MKEQKKKWELLKGWFKSPVKAVHSFSDSQYKCIGLNTENCPTYEEDAWEDYFKRENHNCYNYALNLIFNEYSFVQPGELGFANDNATKQDLKDRKKLYKGDFKKYCTKIIDLAQKDGLIFLGNKLETRPGYRLIALAMSKGSFFWGGDSRDFHWYRQDRDGTWSHKPGDENVGPLKDNKKFAENSGDITFPHEKNADRGKYKKFMGYFLVPEKGIPFNPKKLKKAKEMHR